MATSASPGPGSGTITVVTLTGAPLALAMTPLTSCAILLLLRIVVSIPDPGRTMPSVARSPLVRARRAAGSRPDHTKRSGRAPTALRSRPFESDRCQAKRTGQNKSDPSAKRRRAGQIGQQSRTRHFVVRGRVSRVLTGEDSLGCGEDVAAGGIQAEADRLAALGSGRGEDAGQTAVAGDVDGVLVAAPAERHVGDRPGEMMLAVVRAAQGQRRGPHQQGRIASGDVTTRHSGPAGAQQRSGRLELDGAVIIGWTPAHPDPQLPG